METEQPQVRVRTLDAEGNVAVSRKPQQTYTCFTSTRRAAGDLIVRFYGEFLS